MTVRRKNVKKNMPYILIAGIAFGSDFWIKRHMDRKYARYVVHPGRRNKILIEKYYNCGAALNFLAKKPRVMRALHTVIMFFVGILYYFLLRMPGHRLSKTGASLLVGGGLNNLLDRYTKGYVVDYVKFNFGPKWLRGIIFNISDFCIFIGAFLSVVGSEVTS